MRPSNVVSLNTECHLSSYRLMHLGSRLYVRRHPVTLILRFALANSPLKKLPCLQAYMQCECVAITKFFFFV